MDDNYEEIATEKGSPTEEDQDATKNTEGKFFQHSNLIHSETNPHYLLRSCR